MRCIMLDALMKVVFYSKESDLYKDCSGYNAQITFRPAFCIGGNLYSGTISNDESIYF